MVGLMLRDDIVCRANILAKGGINPIQWKDCYSWFPVDGTHSETFSKNQFLSHLNNSWREAD